MPRKDLTVEPQSPITDLIGAWASQGYCDRAICSQLRFKGFKTAAGKCWTESRVALVIERLHPNVTREYWEATGEPRDRWFPRLPGTMGKSAKPPGNQPETLEQVTEIIRTRIPAGDSPEEIAAFLNETWPRSNFGQEWKPKSVVRFFRKNNLFVKQQSAGVVL